MNFLYKLGIVPRLNIPKAFGKVWNDSSFLDFFCFIFFMGKKFAPDFPKKAQHNIIGNTFGQYLFISPNKCI